MDFEKFTIIFLDNNKNLRNSDLVNTIAVAAQNESIDF